MDGWLSGVSLHWNLCDAEVQQSVWRSTGRGKDGCEMTGRQAAELLGLALDAEGAPWRTHPSSRTSRHIGGARCCCGLFRIDGGRTLPQSDPTTKYKWGNVNKYVVHLGAGSPLKFHGVPASDRTLPRARVDHESISFRESTVATTGQSRSADADHPHSTQQAPAIRPEASSKKRWHGGTSLPQHRHCWCTSKAPH